MIASLPMYAHPSNRAAHDKLWALIRDGLRDRGIAAPDGLDHAVDHMAVWSRDDLVLGHICNLPYRAQFRDKVTLIGASDYGLEGCGAGQYRSHFITHIDNLAQAPADLKGARFVSNDTLSQSGFGAAQLWAQTMGFTYPLHAKTGSHHASIQAVATGQADLATIDAQTWRIQCATNPMTKKIKVIGHTSPSPGMTFVTRKGQDPTPYFAAITDAIAQLPTTEAAILGLTAIVALPPSAYALPLPPAPAQSPNLA